MTDRPTVVVHDFEYGGGETAYRVILCGGADVFGTENDHIAETVAESPADIEDALRELELELRGWDSVTSGDLEWLWENRPDRVRDSARLFAGAVLEDVADDGVVNQFNTSDERNAGTASEDVEAGSEVLSELNSSDDCGHLDEYRIGGQCLRCEQAFNTDDERAVRDGVIS